MGETIIEVRDLKTHFFTRQGVLPAVDGVSFSVERGQVLGLVGESGSGKSVTGLSILGLVDPPGRVVGGSVMFKGENLVGLSQERLRRIRGRHIAMIFQDPMMTLNPVLRVSTQMVEAVQAHEKVSEKAARERSRDPRGRVGIPAAAAGRKAPRGPNCAPPVTGGGGAGDEPMITSPGVASGSGIGGGESYSSRERSIFSRTFSLTPAFFNSITCNRLLGRRGLRFLISR
jgi:hypothetical protein